MFYVLWHGGLRLGEVEFPRLVTYIPVPAPLPVWLKPGAAPSARHLNDVYQAFTCVSHAVKSWPYSCGAFGKMVFSRIPSPLFSGQALSGKLSQETVTLLPCSRRILPVERQVLSVVTSRQLNMRLRVANTRNGRSLAFLDLLVHLYQVGRIG